MAVVGRSEIGAIYIAEIAPDGTCGKLVALRHFNVTEVLAELGAEGMETRIECIRPDVQDEGI